MSRQLNSKRKHYLAPWTDDATKPQDSAYKWLASGITSITNDTEENTEDYADYTGIDTTDILTVKKKWSAEGYLDRDDEAQKIVIDKELQVGDGRKIWHAWVESDGKTAFEGVAKLTDIKIGGGDSNANEAISFSISHETSPTKNPSDSHIPDFTPSED